MNQSLTARTTPDTEYGSKVFLALISKWVNEWMLNLCLMNVMKRQSL